MAYTIKFATEDKCESCVAFRLIQRECLEWASPITEDTEDELMAYLDRRCAGCSDGSWVERNGDCFDVILVTDWAA